MYNIDLTKRFPCTNEDPCEVIDLELDDATISLLRQASERSGRSVEDLLEEALIKMVEGLQSSPEYLE